MRTIGNHLQGWGLIVRAEHVIKEFDGLDPKSFAFRYPEVRRVQLSDNVGSSELAEYAEVHCVPDMDDMEFMSAVYVQREFSKHMHDTHALGIIDAGAGRVWCGGTTHSGGPGDIIWIPPGAIHTGGPLRRGSPFRYRMLYPSQRLVAHAAKQLELVDAPMPSSAPIVRDRTAAVYSNNLFAALTENRDSLEIESLFLMLLAHLAARPMGASYATPPGSLRVGPPPRFVKQVREYLDSNTHANVSLADLARLADVHPLYLCRTFKAHVGLAPHSYAVLARVARAKVLLRDGDRVSDVAMMTGFADQSHLGRHFARVTGVTPASYRRMVARGKDRSSR